MTDKTLLQFTQDILSAIDGDEVNSITDTTEAEQVARIVGRVYENYITNYGVPEERTLFALTGLGDTARPTHMTIPSTIDNVHSVRYNVRTASDTKDKYEPITELSVEDFITMVTSRDSSATDTTAVTEGGVTIQVYNDRAPQYYTLFDDNSLVFDAHNSAVDTTLQQSKSICYGQKSAAFSLTDSFVIGLDANLHPMILNDAISTAFVELKQSANNKAEQEARRHKIKAQNNRNRTGEKKFTDGPNFGRK